MVNHYGIEQLDGWGYDCRIADYLTVRPPTPSPVPYSANRSSTVHVS